MDRNIEYIDIRGSHVSGGWPGSPGNVFVMQPYNIEDWQLGPAKDGDVGMDLPARIKGMKNVEHGPELYPPFPGMINFEEGWIDIPVGSYARIPSGLHVKMPDDSWLMVRPRSSTGFKLRMDTFEGTVDSGYTGPLLALVYNRYTLVKRVFCMIKFTICRMLSAVAPPLAVLLARSLRWGTMRVKDGDRLIQVILVPKYPLKRVVNVDKLPETERGTSGFGSSGGLVAQSEGT